VGWNKKEYCWFDYFDGGSVGFFIGISLVNNHHKDA